MNAMLATLFLLDSIKSDQIRPAMTIGKVAIINKYATFLLSLKLLFLEIKDLIISLISVLKKYITVDGSKSVDDVFNLISSQI